MVEPGACLDRRGKQDAAQLPALEAAARDGQVAGYRGGYLGKHRAVRADDPYAAAWVTRGEAVVQDAELGHDPQRVRGLDEPHAEDRARWPVLHDVYRDAALGQRGGSDKAADAAALDENALDDHADAPEKFWPGSGPSRRAALPPRMAVTVAASRPAAVRRSTGSSTPMSKG